MGSLDALEQFLEGAVEGTVQRLLRPKLQPVQLARAAIRRMEAEQTIGPDGPRVANQYTICLTPRDFERFAGYRQALERDLAAHLDRYARERAWRPLDRIVVELVARDDVPLGRAGVQARFADVSPLPTTDGAAPSTTAALPRVEARPADRPVGSPALVRLTGEQGEQFERRGSLIRLGRALENDVVIRDERISRFHAELAETESGYELRDLGSTNGTRLAERPVERAIVRDGDQISLGGYRLTFRRA